MTARLCKVLVITCVFNSGLFVSARQRQESQQVRVRFLATATTVRGTWAFNQDTYLAQIDLPDGSSSLARIFDEFMFADPPLSAAVLESKEGTVLRLRRDLSCDRSLGSMIFRAAPGDPIANVDGPLSFTPELPNKPEPSSVLPCYRLVRR
jgi:hypothetical protein